VPHLRFNNEFSPACGIPRAPKFYDTRRYDRPLFPGRKRGCMVRLPELKGETIMFIGNFTSSGENYTGVIRTLTFTTEAIFEALEKKGEKSPDYRVTNGSTDIGVAWRKTSEAGNSYLSVSLDDPALAGPITCRLVKVGESYALAWERARKQD
jgi:uncharacterized protein (DUF736 family)